MLVEQFISVMNASGEHKFDTEKFDNTEETDINNIVVKETTMEETINGK